MSFPPASDASETAFLVERYLSPAAAGELRVSVARLTRFCANTSRSGVGVEYVQSAYLPTEDTCFCLFRARSADAVHAINSQADFAFDRITPAVLLGGGKGPAISCGAIDPNPRRQGRH